MSDSGNSNSPRSAVHREGMLWLELTNGCNLACGHCYADSSPGSQRRDRLSHEDYLRLIEEAAAARMATIQFIGGEPFLYRRLPELVRKAQVLGFESIEIFSNLTVERLDVLDAIDPRVTAIATSAYSAVPAVHDRITKRVGSFSRTLAGIRSVVARRVPLRVAFIETDENAGHYERTEAFLRELGVQTITRDRQRAFGRGLAGVPAHADMAELCGSCAGNTLCVTSDGTVLPCVMSRAWPIGRVASSSLSEVGVSDVAAAIRSQIRAATGQRDNGHLTISASQACSPDCGPVHCGPQSCGPRR